MAFWNRTIKKASAFGTAFIAAIVAEHLGTSATEVVPFAGPVMIVLSHLLTHIGGEFVSPIGEEIIEQFNNKNPDQLNHNIQKTLVESMGKAIASIAILYKDKYPSQPLSKKSKKFLRKFKKEFPEYFSPESSNSIDDNELKQIIFTSDTKKDNQYLFNDTNTNLITNKLNELLAKALKEQNIDVPLNNLISEKFLPLMQFYFGEELKNPKNAASRIALERMLSEETLIGINKLLKLQEKTESEIQQLKNESKLSKLGKLPPKKISELKGLLKELNQTGRLEIQYNQALDKKFAELFDQYKALHDDVRNIQSNVHYIRRTLNRYMPAAIIIIVISSVMVTMILVINSRKPFNAVITLIRDPKLNISHQYPPIKYPAKLTLLLPSGKTETATINSNNEGIFLQIDAKWLHNKIQVKLDDIYWETSNDSIELSDKRIDLRIRPNKILAYVEGIILSNKGDALIKDARIWFQGDTTLYADSNGIFKAILPYSMLKEMYVVTVFAKGFDSVTEKFYPNSNRFPFKLSPLKQ